MSKSLKQFLLVLMTAGAVTSASAFSMLGPYTSWQAPAIGYNSRDTDIGGPMNLGEEYRWNTPTLYYGYDESFLNYFGVDGTNAVDQAFAILNALPKFSAMSSNLNEFPMNSTRANEKAAALGLYDLKSVTLSLLMEEMGLASPERYVWTIRNRQAIFPNHTIVKRNFDPVTLAPSSFVNGTLYTFAVVPFTDPTYEDAAEVSVDPTAFHRSVADGIDGLRSGITIGNYYTGLTRDDVGGLRYLYRTNNYQFENLIPGTFNTIPPCPWCPPGGTNVAGTSPNPDIALRPGVDKITFVKGNYDSLVGAFIPVTNVFTAYYVSNNTLHSQSVQRVVTQPDILISAEDLPLVLGRPLLITRTDTAGWANNDALNGQATLDGPGVIQAPITFTYNKIGPFYYDVAPAYLDLDLPLSGLFGWTWGSFDGTTNAPKIFPNGTSINDMEAQVLYGGSGTVPTPYAIPGGVGITNGAAGGN